MERRDFLKTSCHYCRCGLNEPIERCGADADTAHCAARAGQDGASTSRSLALAGLW